MSIQKRATAAVTASVAALLLAACSSSGSTKAPTPAATSGSTSAAGGSTSATDTSGSVAAAGTWGLAPDQSASVRKAGLQMLGAEGQVQHYHAHLDVIVDGKAVTVPAYIGIDETAQRISALHTHDPSGVIHIESPDNSSTFTLGQIFTEWGQPLTATQVGPVAVGGAEVVHVYVNGKEVSDPAAYVLKAHDEIAVWVGAKDQTPQPPSSYTFANGL